MTSKFNRTLRLGYGFSVLLLAVLGLFTYLTVNRLLSGNREIARSGEIVQRLEQLLSVMKDAETGQRGYLLTGNPVFLEPYEGSYSRAIALSQRLDTLTQGDGVQQHHIILIRQILTRRLDKLQLLIDRKRNGLAVAESDLLAGKAAMDALRRVVARAEQDEKQTLALRTGTAERYAFWTPPLTLAAVIAGLLISLAAYNSILRYIAEKNRLVHELEIKEEETAAFNEELTAANEEVTAANEELTAINEELAEAREELSLANSSLEQRVAERTQALQDSEEETQALNEELSALNEELAASNEELMATNEDLAEQERRLQELVDELTEAEKKSGKLAAIVATSDDAIISKTLEGVITSWNHGAERIFGHAEADMIGASIYKLIPEDRHHEEPIIIARIKAGERVEHYETKRQTADGRLIDVSLTISPILDKQGGIIGVSKIARDISEQKLIEQRKVDFIGMASHELKTPLTSLNAMIQVLQQKLRNSDDAVLPAILDKAVRQTKRMTGLINGFLNVSRLESGKLVIDKENFDLSKLIAEQVSDIRLAVSSHSFTIDSCDSMMVYADREKVGSVISNLLSNAVKYSPRAHSVSVTCAITGKEALISVKDEGMGIKPQDLPKLFDRYYRVESEHTRHISGFGVGLYLGAEIVKQHGGRIWAESEKGVGSTFHFTLPLA